MEGISSSVPSHSGICTLSSWPAAVVSLVPAAHENYAGEDDSLTNNNANDEDSEISFMDDDEFQEAILGKSKFDDTDSDSPTTLL